MKLTGKQVTFYTVLPWLFRERISFVGKSNTLQLLETALVIEGYRQRLFLPLLDRFFRRLLSEWTMVTIPYSRIIRFQYSQLWFWRVLFTVPMLLPFLVAVKHEAETPSGMAVLVGLPTLLVACLFHFHVLHGRNYLLFRQANGRRTLLAFRVRSPRQRKKLQALLERYRQDTRKLLAPGKRPIEAV
jgi:hypothetical protein